MMMLQSLTFHLFLMVASSTAFAPPRPQRLPSQLHAADGGAPQYDKLNGILEHAEMVAEGSCMLHIKMDKNDKTQQQLNYKPGHVLALEMKDDSGDLNEDAKKNDGWMRGPYTVSRCNGDDSLDILVRLVGKKSQAFADASPGTPVRFGGQFKVPILDGIEDDAVQQVVFLSTGVGVGPCVGAIELALLEEDEESFPPIALFASYRESNEVAFSEHLEKLSSEHPTKFYYKPIITSATGRISSSETNMELVTSTIQKSIDDTHYHLIGNGQMVNEWKEGLKQAGVPSERVTMEQYFNHRADSDDKAIETIASAVTAACTPAAAVKQA